MAQGTLTESVKTRISKDAKDGIQAIAAQRELEVADIVREAIREFLDRNRATPVRRKAA